MLLQVKKEALRCLAYRPVLAIERPENGAQRKRSFITTKSRRRTGQKANTTIVKECGKRRPRCKRFRVMNKQFIEGQVPITQRSVKMSILLGNLPAAFITLKGHSQEAEKKSQADLNTKTMRVTESAGRVRGSTRASSGTSRHHRRVRARTWGSTVSRLWKYTLLEKKWT